jgi:hypothetical protein
MLPDPSNIMSRCCICDVLIASLLPAAGAAQQECGNSHSCWYSSISGSHDTAALPWQHPRQQQTHVWAAAWQLASFKA